MSGWKKLASAAAASGGAVNAEDLFSTYLYDGTGSTQTITNGIDLSGEGGMVWIKDRHASSQYHCVFDTERGASKLLFPSQDWAESNADATTYPPSGSLRQFNSDGFEVGSYDDVNRSGSSLCAWTFRKAPKFFDIVTYTGTGTNRTISHNLGSTPGMMIVKRLDASGFWAVYHKDLNGGSNPATKFLRLQETSSESGNSGYWNNTEPTDSVFSVGINSYTNHNGGSYVAYLFADNNGDGNFGPNSDQDMIKCGTYTGTGNSSDPFIDVGFEPQWVLIKARTSSTDWVILDNMRGWGFRMQQLNPNSTAIEGELTSGYITSTGFMFDTATARLNSQGVQYVYMAIRRGPMATPESATDVFAIDTRGGTSPTPPELYSGFVTDWLIYPNNINTTNDKRVLDRQRGNRFLYTNKTSTESVVVGEWDYMNGHGDYTNVDSNDIGYMWKRAPGFFDTVMYRGNGTSGRTIPHNLGVEPEMMWVKARNLGTAYTVYHKDVGNQYRGELNSSSAFAASTATWNDTSPTDSVFTVGFVGATNSNTYDYVANLFATLPGISKVGSFSGNNASNRTIDCGFSSGARFVIVKCTNQGGTQWFLWDTERGITTGNDPYLLLNADIAQQSSLDLIEPHSSGFAVNYNAQEDFNQTGNDYIFYAVA